MGAKRRNLKKSKPKPKPLPPLPPIVFEDTEPEKNIDGFTLGEKLGKGAFGSVYQGLDTIGGGLVAIKTIALRRYPNALSGIESEIDLMSSLDNEHIVKYIGSHKTDDFLYIIMEYAEGGSLQHVQKKFANFDEHLAATHLYQVLQGLDYLHQQSIIHRDIKAANILINHNIVKLSDFGISVKFTDGTKSDADLSTFSPYWAAPEVINMEPITEKCDIWSLGITAIEIFCGQPPYFELPAMSAMYKISQNQELPLPDNITPDFRDFLQQCLNRNVNFRKSAAELLDHRWIVKHTTGQDLLERPIKNNSLPGEQVTNNLEIFRDFGSDDDEDIYETQTSTIIKTDSNMKILPLMGDTLHKNVNPIQVDTIDFDDVDDSDNILKPKRPKNLDVFQEDDDQEDFEFVGKSGPSTNQSMFNNPIMSLNQPLKASNNMKKIASDDEWDDDDDFTGSFPGPQIGLSAPKRCDFNEIDSILAPEEDPTQIENTRQANLINKVKQMLVDLNNIEDEEKMASICQQLEEDFKKEPKLKANLTEYHGAFPLCALIQSKEKETLLKHILPVLITALKGTNNLQETLCMFGVLPFLFEYIVDSKYSKEVQVLSLQTIVIICSSKKKPLQMCISAGGLTKLSGILAKYDHQSRPEITPMVIDIINSVFQMNAHTPKVCFARILAQSNLLELLALRFVALDKDDPTTRTLCNLFEHFSQADTTVKLKMATKKFIDLIFKKAGYVPNKPPEISEWNLLSIVRSLNNLAMDTSVTLVLWGTELVPNLIKYLNINKNSEITMNPTLNIIFTALFHMSVRNLQKENVVKIAGIIPMIIHIIKHDSPGLKDLAIKLLLSFINEHAGETQMRLRLESSGAITTLFNLFTTFSHKEQIITALAAWANSQSMNIQKALLAKVDQFSSIIIDYLNPDNFSTLSQFVDRLISICHKCPELTRALAQKDDLVSKIISILLEGNFVDRPENVKQLCVLLSDFYKSHPKPKVLISRHRIDKVAKKLARHSEIQTVREIGQELLLGVSSNFIL